MARQRIELQVDPLILYSLLNGYFRGEMEVRHFASTDFQRNYEIQRASTIDTGINKKMLTQQLRELEYYDIVHREVYNQIPPLNKARQMVATSRSTGKTV